MQEILKLVQILQSYVSLSLECIWTLGLDFVELHVRSTKNYHCCEH